MSKLSKTASAGFFEACRLLMPGQKTSTMRAAVLGRFKPLAKVRFDAESGN